MTQRQDEQTLRRTISLTGAISLVVGGVVGAGIFVLVREIAAKAGGAIWLAFAVAMVISLIGVIPLIQLAGVLPRAGGGYYFASRLLHPIAGVFTSYWILLGGASSTVVVLLTFAFYLEHVVPAGTPPHLVAGVLLLAFYFVCLLGVRLAISLQVLMAAQFVAALVIYGVAGLLHATPALAAWPPHGAGAFAEAVLLAYSTCMGFQVIAEMGEEIKDAQRNIPLALLIGGALVAAIYIVTGTVFVSTVPLDPQALSGMAAPLNTSGAAFLSPWMLQFLSLGAITASLTSLNAAAIALPREIYAQARDQFLPGALAHVGPRTGAPQRAVTAYFVLVGLLLLGAADVDFYGFVAAIGILAVTGVICVAALGLHHRYPQLYDRAYIRFPYPLLVLCTVVTVLVCVLLGLALLVQRPSVLFVYLGWSLLVLALYVLRSRGAGAAVRARWGRLDGVDAVDAVDPRDN